MEEPIRNFPLGSEWLYYKLYMGSKTSEQFLISKIQPFANSLLSNEKIDKWFFINYNDPKSHIRVRFHLIDEKKDLNLIISLFKDIINPLVEERLISEVLVSTYKREIERYGKYSIEDFESLFYFNSELVINIINSSGGDPDMRWLWGIKAIDRILSDWGLDLFSKSEIFKNLTIYQIVIGVLYKAYKSGFTGIANFCKHTFATKHAIV